MNRIKAIHYKSQFATTAHLVIAIDGQPLDELLHLLQPNHHLIGLVPAISWLFSQRERSAAIQALTAEPGLTINAPVLVCGDDRDFHCTVVIAQCRYTEDLVEWLAFGLDVTKDYPHSEIGSRVAWFEGIGPFAFKRDEYLDCIKALIDEPW